MCPKPGMILRITATASLAFASAVSVGTPRVQSHLSQCCASFARRCPQYGHGSVFPGGDSASVRGASVYSTFMRVIEGSQTERNSSSKENVAPRAEGGPTPSKPINDNTGDGLPSGRSRNIGFQITSDLPARLIRRVTDL